MPPEQLILLAVAVLVVGFLYSSVGHAGASGYIAVMTLAGLAPAEIKPMALMLNILVAIITSLQFYRAGYFSWAFFWPFALLAVPMAFLGGYVKLPPGIFKPLVGLILLFSAYRFLVRPSRDEVWSTPGRVVCLGSGGLLGLLSGLTGTGGGIFLTPLLLFKHWATAKQAAATSAMFILLNSSAGLAGTIASTKYLPAFAPVIAMAAVTGGLAGSYCGSRRFDHTWIKRILAVVLLIAGTKLVTGV